MATGFCSKKPQGLLLIIKLIQIPDVEHGPEAVSPEPELGCGTEFLAAHFQDRTSPWGHFLWGTTKCRWQIGSCSFLRNPS